MDATILSPEVSAAVQEMKSARDDFNRASEKLVQLSQVRAEYAAAANRVGAAKKALEALGVREDGTYRRGPGRPAYAAGSRSERERDARRAARALITRARTAWREAEKAAEELRESRKNGSQYIIIRSRLRDVEHEIASYVEGTAPGELAEKKMLLESELWGGKQSPDTQILRIPMDHRRTLNEYAEKVLGAHYDLQHEWREAVNRGRNDVVSARELEDALLDLVTRAARR